MIVDELNRVNQRKKPRNIKETMLKAGNYVVPIESAMGDLISDCITSGVKLARHHYGLLYGTREVAIVIMKKTIMHARIDNMRQR